MATLVTLLVSQETRDAAPCVMVQVGQWILSRSGIIGPVYDLGIAELKGYVFVGKVDDRIGDSATFDRDDIIWSGDLPAQLTAMDALLTEAYAGNKQMEEQWNRLQDLVQALESQLAVKDAEIEALKAQLADIKEAWDWWQVDPHDRCASVVDDAIR